jgi:hypothetical protein
MRYISGNGKSFTLCGIEVGAMPTSLPDNHVVRRHIMDGSIVEFDESKEAPKHAKAIKPTSVEPTK